MKHGVLKLFIAAMAMVFWCGASAEAAERADGDAIVAWRTALPFMTGSNFAY